MRSRFVFLALTYLLTSASCSDKQMTPAQMLAYIKDDDHGLLKRNEPYKGLVVEAYLLRPELFLTQDKINKGSGLVYLMLSFSYKGQELLTQFHGQNNYAALLEKLSFNSGQEVVLRDDQERPIEFVNSHFTNSFGLGSSNDLLLVFREPDHPTDLSLKLEEIGLNTGDLKFDFLKKDIERFYNIRIIQP